jgi:hypothetical protein
MLRSAGARHLRKTLRRCPAGAKIAQKIAPWTWDVTHERALSPADLFGGIANSASWGLNWPSGANLLAHMQLKWIPLMPL